MPSGTAPERTASTARSRTTRLSPRARGRCADGWEHEFRRRTVGLHGGGANLGWDGVLRHIVREDVTGVRSGHGGASLYDLPDNVLTGRMFALLGEFVSTRSLTDPIALLATALRDGTVLGVGVGSTREEIEQVFGPTDGAGDDTRDLEYGMTRFGIHGGRCAELTMRLHELWTDGPVVVPGVLARVCAPFPRLVRSDHLIEAAHRLDLDVRLDEDWPFSWLDTVHVGGGRGVAFVAGLRAPIPFHGVWAIRCLAVPRAAPDTARAVLPSPETPFPETIAQVVRRPGMYGVRPTYGHLVAWLAGHGVAAEHPDLVRFQQWLADRGGLDARTPWWRLVAAGVAQESVGADTVMAIDDWGRDEQLVFALRDHLLAFIASTTGD